MSEVFNQWSPNVELGETAAWLDALYGRCNQEDGELIFVSPCKRQVFKACRIGSPDALVTAAKAVCGHRNLYLKINVMDADAMRKRAIRERKGRHLVGKAAEVKTAVSIHLDVDAGKSEKYLSRPRVLEALGSMPQPPSLVVNSDGGEGGFHCYWILREPYRIKDEADRKRISKAAVRWQKKLNELLDDKLDSTADICRVLRVVGGERNNGNRVFAHSYDPDRLYTLDDLWLPPSQEEVKRESSNVVREIVKDTLGDVAVEGDKPITKYIDACNLTPADLLQQNDYTHLRGNQWLRSDSESGARTLMLSSKNSRPGINVYSGNDPHFDAVKDDGSVGRYHSIDSMFVQFRFNGDWDAAADFCKAEIAKKLLKGGKR